MKNFIANIQTAVIGTIDKENFPSGEANFSFSASR